MSMPSVHRESLNSLICCIAVYQISAVVLYIFLHLTGHGFKLSPVFGKLIAELVIGGSPSHDLSHFRIARFLTPTSHF